MTPEQQPNGLFVGGWTVKILVSIAMIAVGMLLQQLTFGATKDDLQVIQKQVDRQESILAYQSTLLGKHNEYVAENREAYKSLERRLEAVETKLDTLLTRRTASVNP